MCRVHAHEKTSRRSVCVCVCSLKFKKYLLDRLHARKERISESQLAYMKVQLHFGVKTEKSDITSKNTVTYPGVS